MKNILKTTFACAILTLICAFSIFALTQYNQTKISEKAQIIQTALSTEDVKTVQTKLKRWGYFNGPITGYYGPLTTEAVKYFQRVNGIEQTGTVGPITAKALGMGYLYSTKTSSNSSSDLYL